MNPEPIAPVRGIRGPRRSVLTRLAWLAAFAVVTAPGAWAIKEGEVFTDWKVGCDKMPDGKTRCFLYQTINDDKDRPMLHAAVGYLPENGKPAAAFTVPLGVALPPGLAIKIDDDKPIRLPYERCLPHGCVAGLPLEQEILDKFKRGAKMQVIVFDHRGAVEMPSAISLSGFTKGFNALEK